MANPLQVLIVEDRPADAELMVQELQRAGFGADWQRVETERDFSLRLTPRLDLILSDYALPGFGALKAIEVLRASGLDVPLIIVSGSLGDEKAAEVLKLGATDYILKDRMARLGPAVQRALRERQVRRDKASAEEALRASEEQMRGILGTIQDVVWSLSLKDWKILYMSPAGAAMFGRPVSDFYENGQLWLDSVHPEDRGRMAASQQEMIRWGTGDVTFRILRADGTIRHVHTRAWCAYVDGKPYRLEGINTDITERLQAEEDLRRQHAALEEAQAIAHLGSWEWDPVADLATLSKEGWRIWDLEPGSARGNKEFLALVHPEDRPRFEAAIAAAVAEGKDYDCTVRTRTKAGEAHTRHRGRVSARDAAGRAIRLNGTVEDVTERAQAEARRLELEQVQKERRLLEEQNEFKSQFLNMVAHDLNNVLSPMRIYLKMVGDEAAQRGEPPSKPLLGLRGSIERIAGFLADLLDAARLQSGQILLATQRFDLALAVREAVETTRPQAESLGLALAADLPASLEVEADRRRIDQVLGNLLSNAMKFTPSGGTVRVRLAVGGDEVHLSVEDTGRGIAPENLGKLFQPFTRLGGAVQGAHTGTGLGLFICRGIAEAHGGRVAVESAGLGHGTTFRVALPLARVPPLAPQDVGVGKGRGTNR
jgi:PAS domain S-box-containing protein